MSKMNYFATIIFLIISVVVDQSFAKSCRTCRGSGCFQKDVLQLECTQFVPALPFENQLLINNNVGDLKYGCLNLEYYIDDVSDHIEQCILTTDLQSFCETLHYSLKVIQCTVQSIDGSRNIRSLSDIETSADELQFVNAALVEANVELEEGSGDEPTDITTGSSVDTTTSQASATHFISLSFLLCIFLIKLIIL